MNKRLNEIIKLYKRYYNQKPDGCMALTKKQKNLVGAINVAALSKDGKNKKHPHQYRVPNNALLQWSDILIQNIDRIRKVKDFDSLLQLLGNLANFGIGKLTIYDTATRLGAYLNLYPEKIYLHAGTKIGAEKLLGSISGNSISREILPKPFHSKGLECWEIEDILCIFKNEFDPGLSENAFKSLCLKRKVERDVC